jgi:hypothetical protein
MLSDSPAKAAHASSPCSYGMENLAALTISLLPSATSRAHAAVP